MTRRHEGLRLVASSPRRFRMNLIYVLRVAERSRTMNRTRSLILLLSGALLLALLGGADAGRMAAQAPTTAQGTAFTYQGQLKNAAGLVSGACDFQFTLFAAASDGAPL